LDIGQLTFTFFALEPGQVLSSGENGSMAGKGFVLSRVFDSEMDMSAIVGPFTQIPSIFVH
jgi:hypothetical protein